MIFRLAEFSCQIVELQNGDSMFVRHVQGMYTPASAAERPIEELLIYYLWYLKKNTALQYQRFMVALNSKHKLQFDSRDNISQAILAKTKFYYNKKKLWSYAQQTKSMRRMYDYLTKLLRHLSTEENKEVAFLDDWIGDVLQTVDRHKKGILDGCEGSARLTPKQICILESIGLLDKPPALAAAVALDGQGDDFDMLTEFSAVNQTDADSCICDSVSGFLSEDGTVSAVTAGCGGLFYSMTE